MSVAVESEIPARPKDKDILSLAEEQKLGRQIENGRLSFLKLEILKRMGLIDFEEFPEFCPFFDHSRLDLIAKTPFPSSEIPPDCGEELKNWQETLLASPLNKKEGLRITSTNLLENLNQAQEARNTFIEKNFRLVNFWAFKIYSWNKTEFLTLEDLIQDGHLGLIKAVENYNWRKGFKFSTYGSWWIKETIERNIVDQEKCRPQNAQGEIERINRAVERLYLELEREPTKEEISQETGIKLKKVKEYLCIMARSAVSWEKLEGEAKQISLGNLLPDPGPSTEESVDHLLFQEELQKVLALLPKREQVVLKNYYGLLGQKPQSLQEIGKNTELSRERIRQLKNKALKTIAKEILAVLV